MLGKKTKEEIGCCVSVSVSLIGERNLKIFSRNF